MIYGATGYMGKLLTRRAKALGLRPLLAGRNAARLRAVADESGFEYRVVDLADGTALRQAVAEVDAVLHVAGPFSQTSPPMLEACLAARKHYLDITGEIDVFEACAGSSAAALQASRSCRAAASMSYRAIVLQHMSSGACPTRWR